MGFLKNIKESIKEFFNPTYEPLICKPQDVFDLMIEDFGQNLGGVPLVMEYNNKIYKIGSLSEYDHRSKTPNGFCNYKFYVNDTEYATLEEFIAQANIDGVLLANMESIKLIATEITGPDEYMDVRTYLILEDRYTPTKK